MQVTEICREYNMEVRFNRTDGRFGRYPIGSSQRTLGSYPGNARKTQHIDESRQR